MDRVSVALKPSNPKDSVGINKIGMSVVPMNVVMEAALGMTEGALKYGRHNYRDCGVRASVYYDALLRHIGAWWEGEDVDTASNLSHVAKAISCLIVLRDSMLRGNWVDDRPPKSTDGWMEPLNARVTELRRLYPAEGIRHFTEL